MNGNNNVTGNKDRVTNSNMARFSTKQTIAKFGAFSDMGFSMPSLDVNSV